MTRLILTALATTAFVAPSFAAELSTEKKDALKAAFETKNEMVLNATVKALSAGGNSASQDVMSYLNTLKNPAPKAEKTKEQIAEEVWRVWSPSLWSGTVDLGVDLQNGNTKQRAFNGALGLVRSTDEWKTTLDLKGKMKRENNVRTDEEYKVAVGANYKLTEKSVVFGDVEYVNDPFSGLSYRLTEIFGFGRNVLKTPTMKWDVKAGIGGRHSKANAEGAQREDELIFKPSAEFNWKINEGLSFNQKLATTMGGEVIISEATSALKSKIAENWFFKVEVDVEHIDQVEPGKKNTDTSTTLNLVYEF